VAIELILRTEHGTRAMDEVGIRPVHAPHLLDAEVGFVLRRLEHATFLTADQRLAKVPGKKATVKLLRE
jgi:predicted nucleic acid-binding protein